MAEWFESWFDTAYYHMLYNRRNDEEASMFIRKLFESLNIPSGSKVADIACGKGRHSAVMANLGMLVHGYDLSPNSIEAARDRHIPGAEFSVQDMRQPFAESGFDAAFNLFTSFGYFDREADDVTALRNIYNMLRPGGLFVQDYINGTPLLQALPWEGTESREHVTFGLHKYYQAPFIRKHITVNDRDAVMEFEEQVKVYTVEELQRLHTLAGFHPVTLYGSYQLDSFEAAKSPRIIIISERI